MQKPSYPGEMLSKVNAAKSEERSHGEKVVKHKSKKHKMAAKPKMAETANKLIAPQMPNQMPQHQMAKHLAKHAEKLAKHLHKMAAAHGGKEADSHLKMAIKHLALHAASHKGSEADNRLHKSKAHKFTKKPDAFGKMSKNSKKKLSK